jgi:hypothetical protein
VGQAEEFGDAMGVDEVGGVDERAHDERVYVSRRIRPARMLVSLRKQEVGPGGARTPRGPAETRKGGPDNVSVRPQPGWA